MSSCICFRADRFLIGVSPSIPAIAFVLGDGFLRIIVGHAVLLEMNTFLLKVLNIPNALFELIALFRAFFPMDRIHCLPQRRASRWTGCLFLPFGFQAVRVRLHPGRRFCRIVAAWCRRGHLNLLSACGTGHLLKNGRGARCRRWALVQGLGADRHGEAYAEY